MTSIYDIANWFLYKESMTHKKLQKLCYYAYAWNYALRNSLLVNDTEFQAWIHGPVSPELYSKYQGNGWNTLPQPSTKPDIDDQTEELLDSVWETYGGLSGNSLEVLTHNEPPWKKARLGSKSNEPSKAIIEKEDMRSYYLSIYEGSDE